jgi:hypothetical protein
LYDILKLLAPLPQGNGATDFSAHKEKGGVAAALKR